MTEILPIFFITIAFAFFSNSFSTFDRDLNNYVKKEKIFLVFIIMSWTIFAGLRLSYNDTLVYTWIYDNETPVINSAFFEDFKWDIGENPGFHLTMSIMKTLGFSSQTFLLLFSLATYTCYCWFIHKYTSNIMMSFYMMFTFSGFTFPLAAIKQCFAMAIALIAVDRLLNKKRIAFVLLLLLAIVFHPYALMFFICPILFFKPWTRKTWYMLLAFAVIGVSLQFLVGRIVDVTTMLGEGYTADSFTGEGVNPFRVAVCLAPLVLSFVVKNNFDYNSISKEDSLFLNLSILNGGIMFVGLFGTANYFGRLANYFSLFPNITIPWLLKYVDRRYKEVIYFAAIVAYFLFFLYGVTHSGMGNFNSEFSRITLWEYLKSINIL